MVITEENGGEGRQEEDNGDEEKNITWGGEHNTKYR